MKTKKKRKTDLLVFAGNHILMYEDVRQIRRIMTDNLIRRGLVKSACTITSETYPVAGCTSCLKCFEDGECFLDEEDSMKEIKRLALETELILFLIRGFGNEIPPEDLAVAERLRIWNYSMPLIGKLGVTVTLIDEAGELFLSGYASKLLSAWGCGIVDELIMRKGQVSEMVQMRMADQVCGRLEEYLSGRRRFEVPQSQDYYFQMSRRAVRKLEEDNFLKNSWRRRRMLDAVSLQNVFDEYFLKEEGERP
ncbi:MAG: hypothetical protein ACOYBC_03650 [Bilifractor sp.]